MTNPTDVVNVFLKAFEQKDYTAACQLISDNCEYTNMPLGMGTVKGPEGVRAVLEPFFAPTLSNEFLILHCVSHGDIVFTERLDRHQLHDKWVELPVAGVFEVNEGKIVMWREYFDLNTIMSEWPQN
jgi:limonene-1,2-epoxide hydrolase